MGEGGGGGEEEGGQTEQGSREREGGREREAEIAPLTADFTAYLRADVSGLTYFWKR